MDESERDHRTDPRQADPVPTGQLDIDRIVHARGLARAELTIGVVLVLGATLLLFVFAPTFLGGPGLHVSRVDVISAVAALTGLFGGLAWMIRIYRRSFGYEEDPPPWRSRHPR